MGLIVNNFELPGGDIVDSAYLRIQNINTSNVDHEIYENIPGTDDQKISWQSYIKSSATLYVWADEIARQNRTHPIHWFTIEFKYDLKDPRNIYEQAYDQIFNSIVVDQVNN